MDNKLNISINIKPKNLTGPKLGAGFAPAHLTGIFQIYNTNPDPLKCGSRGFGICINKGVYTFLKVKSAKKQTIKTYFNGLEISAQTTKDTIRNIVGDVALNFTIYSFTDLPLSQGFGLSGAAAISTALALNSALDLKLDYTDLINAAHIAEIKNHTGLGDIVAQATGGIVIRKIEGGLGYGELEQAVLDKSKNRLVICQIGSKLKTESIISDPHYITKINNSGKKYIAKINKHSTLSELITQSFKFATETGLVKRNVQNIIERIHSQNLGAASMIMLGNSIFATGKITKIVKVCSEFGDPMVCQVSKARARVLIR